VTTVMGPLATGPIAQLGVGAITGIHQDDARMDRLLLGRLDQVQRNLRLGLERHIGRNLSAFAAIDKAARDWVAEREAESANIERAKAGRAKAAA
jgi:hypothetical protein